MNSANDTSERHHHRFAIRCDASWCVNSDAPLSVEVLDVSAHGAFVASDSPLAAASEGAPIRLRAQLGAPWDTELDVQTVVRWSGFSQTHGRSGHGLEFHAPEQQLGALLAARAWWPAP